VASRARGLPKESIFGKVGMAEETTAAKAAGQTKGWKVRRVGSATFAISKPKRSRRKLRQMRLKNRRRAR